MIEIKDYKDNKRFQHHYDVIKANAPVSYGGLKLYEGKRNYLRICSYIMLFRRLF